jgi:hypothetical protein
MILRISHSSVTETAAEQNAWIAFAKTQQAAHDFAGCISQPAHAALAGRLAESFSPDIFGPMTPEVIDSIARHDAGWAGPDLAALESAGEKQPQSFIACTPQAMVEIWRRSIREAEARSLLGGILTSRHFCLLAPRDGDPEHESFAQEETERRIPQETASPLSRDDLNRFTAALGFCDLLSLCLCSGLVGSLQMRLAHGADPAAHHASKVMISLSDETLRCNPSIMAPGTGVYVDGWMSHAPNALACHRFQWTVG